MGGSQTYLGRSATQRMRIYHGGSGGFIPRRIRSAKKEGVIQGMGLSPAGLSMPNINKEGINLSCQEAVLARALTIMSQAGWTARAWVLRTLGKPVSGT